MLYIFFPRDHFSIIGRVMMAMLLPLHTTPLPVMVRDAHFVVCDDQSDGGRCLVSAAGGAGS